MISGADDAVDLHDYVMRAAVDGELVVQPRMGMASPRRMSDGLRAVAAAAARTVGTITLDSYTRVGDEDGARRALAQGLELNGYPIVAHGPQVTASVAAAGGAGMPVQVRHGSAVPGDIFAAIAGAGLTATEGGPVSYCLPYSRMPLAVSVDNWRQSCETLAEADAHLETFAGCMMGQLCPPAMLVALSVLEGMFFWQHGIRCISLSYAQQTHAGQDEEAVAALRDLTSQYLPHARTHVVIYTYMGVYPRTPHGALTLLGESARLAVRSGASRLIVKTAAEAHRIPAVAENVTALEHAAMAALGVVPVATVSDTGIYAQAKALVDNVLSLDADLGRALVDAFAHGYLDVPYCLHPDNAGQARSYLDPAGRLGWSELGSLPLHGVVERHHAGRITSSTLMSALSHVQHAFDTEALEQPMRAIGGGS